jgi:PilZ domain
VKIFRRGKPAQPAPATAVDLPERLAEVRLRVTVTIPAIAPVGVPDTDPDTDPGAGGGGGEVVVDMPSRVEEIDEPLSAHDRLRLMITAPEVAFLPAPVDLTIEHTLLWVVPDGQMELPVHIQDTQQLLWPLIVTGPARKVQRRQYVRVPLDLPGDLTCNEPDDTPGRWAVTLLDVSEGGVSCLVPDIPPPAGAWVTICFPGPDATALSCRGVVLEHLPHRADPAGTGRPTAAPAAESTSTTVAIRFDDPEEHGDAIRHMIFAEQLHQRQIRLDSSAG